MIAFHSLELGCPQGQAPTLLFLHGFMGSCEDWRLVMEQLGESFHCLAIDLPGHGKTRCDQSSLYRMENTAVHLANWATQNDVSRCSIVGYSMGGRLSLYCALRFPQRFPQAVIESASPGLRKPKDQKSRRDMDFARSYAVEADFLNFLSGWYQQPLFTSLGKHSSVFNEMRKRRLCNDPVGLGRSLREMGTGVQPSLWPELSCHRNPILLLTGELDQKFTGIAQEMRQNCTMMRHEVVAGVGHNIHLEDPGAIAHQIQRFVSATPACALDCAPTGPPTCD